MLEVFDPHEPFDPPFPYDEMYNPDYKGQRFIWPTYGKSDLYSEEELKEIRALYAGEVTMVDRWLGHLLDNVEHLGLMDDTMIIVVTDHGHLFGEHGMIANPGQTRAIQICIRNSRTFRCSSIIPMDKRASAYRIWYNRWTCSPPSWTDSTFRFLPGRMG